MHTGEPAFRDPCFWSEEDADRLIETMAAQLALIERPVVLTTKGACIGRRPERVLAVLQGASRQAGRRCSPRP